MSQTPKVGISRQGDGEYRLNLLAEVEARLRGAGEFERLTRVGNGAAAVVEGQTREFVEELQGVGSSHYVWKAVERRRVREEALTLLERAIERRCLKCGDSVSDRYGARGRTLCESCHVAEQRAGRPPDALRKHLAAFLRGLAAGWTPPLPDDAAPLTDEEAETYARLVADLRAALDAAEPDEQGVKRIGLE
jgi:hypothetical protein